jgi:hypothetical protein
MLKAKLFGMVAMTARRRRSDLLVRLLKPLQQPLTILDVGGTVEYWRTVNLPPGLARQIVLLNKFVQQASIPFETVVGDACDLSRYNDCHFDLVFSNSVIGHVGSFADQQRMAREIRRVGKYFFVQTPNHSFPLDWRTLVPFFHFLPVETQAWCFEHFPVGTNNRARNSAEAMHLAVRVRNIRRQELALLFPQANVVNERVLGFTKSFMIHNLPVK